VRVIIRKNLFFFIPFFLYILGGGIALACVPKKDLHLFFNSFYTPFFDFFFQYYTHLGDGLTVILVALALGFVNYRTMLALFLAYLLSSLLTQTLKLTWFDDCMRPVFYFQHEIHTPLRLVPGVDMEIKNSFPSGHTTSAFCLFSFLAFISKRNITKMACFILALSISYSRIYLSKHFFADVFAGSLIGTLLSLLLYDFFFHQPLTQRWTRLNKSFRS
jgi:membrane-associated phospholipid phosphatase